MIRFCLLAIMLALGAAPGPRSGADDKAGSATTPKRYSRGKLRELVGNARTAEDHDKLAAYFRAKERELRAKEVYHWKALEDYMDKPHHHPAKYPTRGNAARHLAERYRAQANEAGEMAELQERLANGLRASK